MKPALYIPLIAAGLGITAIAGFYLGKQGGEAPESSQTNPPQTEESAQKPDITPEAIAKAKNVPATLNNPLGDDVAKSSQTTSPQTEEPAQKTTNSTTQAPQKRAITSEAIAKAKNVPATLSNPQGDYSLVAVIEGADANRRLNQRLKVVGAQRQRLAALTQQFEKTPANFMQQRELTAGQINETRKALEVNLRLMAQNYAYSLKNNYVKVPHEISLLSVTEKVSKAGKARTVKRVYAFKNTGDYENFQKKRDVYLRLKLEQAKAAQAAVLVERGTATPVPRNLKPTPKMDVISKELQQLYRYDPERTYQINLEKTAIYARPAR